MTTATTPKNPLQIFNLTYFNCMKPVAFNLKWHLIICKQTTTTTTATTKSR